MKIKAILTAAALAMTSLSAVPAFAYDGPVAAFAAPVPDAHVLKSPEKQMYAEAMERDIDVAILAQLGLPFDADTGIRISTRINRIDLGPKVAQGMRHCLGLQGVVHVRDAHGKEMGSFPIALRAAPVKVEAPQGVRVKAPSQMHYYAALVDSFALDAVAHIRNMPGMSS